ncbi:YndJ family protein [Peribacillus deserti]|uniref:YndJ-like protein n=1 Tax=Peribacillus deserti TaxID=673318 RepID=A0A2N5M9I3_9BACI|nr:YndJ family protein [Peribacillus deserti]PLT31017.1 hypothetical protein CUU66_04215 [Peribacillus deserti]
MELLFLQIIILLSIVFYIPLHFKLIQDNSGMLKLLRTTHPVFALSAVFSFWFPVLSFFWFFFCLMACVYAMWRLFKRGGFYIEETLIDFSLMYLPVGGIWFIVYQMDWSLYGFSSTIALLTAIHFHYSSLFALLFLSLMGRELKNLASLPKWYTFISMVFISSPILVAIGITYSRTFEIFSVILFAIGLILYAFFSFRLKSTFISLSSATILFTMFLSILYSFRTVDIPFMIYFHGIVNAILFTGLGLIGYLRLSPKSHFDMTVIPFSSIIGDNKIGIDFFERHDLIDMVQDHPHGMVDEMNMFEHTGFHPSDIHPNIVDFYVNTVSYDMDVQPKWNRLVYPFALLYKRWSMKMEQMNFPTLQDENDTKVNSEMFKIKDEKDGRNNVRAWVRSDKKNQKAIYVAAYSTHQNNKNERFYNVYFPLPFGGMTSVLRINHFSGGGVSLTSLSDKRKDDHNGVYLTILKKKIRLPINETIDVWNEDRVIKAYHISYLFGIPVLQLHYQIKKKVTFH